MKKILLPVLLVSLLINCSKDSESEKEPDLVAPTLDFIIEGVSGNSTGQIVVSNQIEISINAQDNDGIAMVEAFINDEKVGQDNSPPYSIVVDISKYSSKSAAGKYKDYNLKITATDLSGNVGSAQQIINIDNELPGISDVTLLEGMVISGIENDFSFNVGDNEELISVNVFLNDSPLAHTADETYQISINSLDLTDGNNELRIVAEDVASNIATYSVGFIVDNTGPEIATEQLVDGQIVDEFMNIELEISDAYSEFNSLEIKFNDTVIAEFKEDGLQNLDFDPETFPVGEGELRFEATDGLGNVSTSSIGLSIVRRLIKIEIPEQYLSLSIMANHYVFASRMDGTLIDIQQLTSETRELILRSTSEFTSEEEFMITFITLIAPNWKTSHLYTIANLKRDLPGTLNLKAPNRNVSSGLTEYPLSGISEPTYVNARGSDYYFTGPQNGGKALLTFSPVNHMYPTEQVYMYYFNPLNNYMAYQLLDKPIANDFVIDFADFTDASVEERIINSSMTNINYWRLELYGYQNETDFNNEVFHSIYSYGLGIPGLNEYRYQLNTLFYDYSHQLSVGNYYTEGRGLPSSSIEQPGWTLDYNFSNNELQLTTSGAEHHVGMMSLSGGYSDSAPYEWQLVFDSQNTDMLVIPEIPDLLDFSEIYTQYQNSELEFGQVAISRFENIVDYPNYIDLIVKDNKSFVRTAYRFEAIYKRIDDGTFYFNPRNDFLYNDW